MNPGNVYVLAETSPVHCQQVLTPALGEEHRREMAEGKFGPDTLIIDLLSVTHGIYQPGQEAAATLRLCCNCCCLRDA